MRSYFAEGLPRLGLVNLHVALEELASDDTISLSFQKSDSAAILTFGDGQNLQIPLPLAPTSSQSLQFPSNQSRISARIAAVKSTTEVDPKPVLTAEDIQQEYQSSWTIECRQCHKSLVSNKPMRFKDLPSESWYEYMDYWLCHPSGSHDHSHSRNHESEHPSNSAIVPTTFDLKASPGVALVGLTYLLVHKDDTANLSIKVPFSNPMFGCYWA
jgi:HECT-like Ubiquitin-conjugating enzyme (E2)-binding